jgi:hypothetical protein
MKRAMSKTYSYPVKLIANNEIDPVRWDQAISNAPNSRVYAESWYLDSVAPGWAGLVYGDYEYVMPVCPRKKLGITYAYQPTYTQQHGIFPTATPAITALFIDKLKQSYKYFNISLNSLNVSAKEWVKSDARKNYILSLNNNYEALKKNYSTHTKRYLPKAKESCNVMPHLSAADFLKLKNSFAQKSFTGKNLKTLGLIINKSLSTSRGIIYGAYTRNNQLVAAAFFLKGQKRVIYLNSVSTPDGKASRAMYAIIDRFIADHAGNNIYLDFEGSNIEGIARFFAGFGAKPETYQQISYNNLPWWLKPIKK